MKTLILIMLICYFTNSNYGMICPQCNGSGKVEIICNTCNGSGYEMEDRRYSQGNSIHWITYGSTTKTKSYGIRQIKVACKQCFKGLRGPNSVGSGKIKVTCNLCNGRKFISNKTLENKKNILLNVSKKSK